MADIVENDAAKPLLNAGGEPLKLSDLLDRGWKIYEEVAETNEPLASSDIQGRVRMGLRMLEEASRMVAQLDLFSRNEELEEIATTDLKYMQLPALLGALTLKQTGVDRRPEIIQAAKTYFVDFLRRCKEYDVAPFEMPKPASENKHQDSASQNGLAARPPSHCSSDLVAMAAQRQAKIERYRQQKRLESQLSDVRKAVDRGQANEEVMRSFYLLSIQRWITVCLEEIESIAQELEILRNMDGLKRGGGGKQKPQNRPPMKPFILTKDAMQAQVFGAGYPSLATMTVDEWYDQHKKQGVLPDQGVAKKMPHHEESERGDEKDTENDNDDDASVQKARNWDDWKDTHQRGYGNRHNMG